MSGDAEKKLLVSILRQANISHIDWDRVAKDLSVPTKSVAQMRWQRFKKILPDLNQEQNGNVNSSPPVTPRKRQSPTKSKAPKGSPLKKRKRLKVDSDDDDEEPEFNNYDEKENKIAPETPARSLPGTSDEEDDVKNEESDQDEETQETELTQGTFTSGGTAVDSGSDFDGDLEP
ncbi:uncharacterized protein EAF01_004681 [Botrytis porri]|uniref:Myb-like DNA-binding domain-containing protein n=1 Tax=Botrytis porri TaxID=87229 RepID=A0A4Z1K9E7_9HELO|nr:uncharacterized protein EAF01_004681 [Botrytis porri]KAF7907094.1 hypothetical protein EAF01_004681 [Botrytis porri]TGO82723.1 hypothetical protein BPOR_0770g00020 [Botrytis porri]